MLWLRLVMVELLLAENHLRGSGNKATPSHHPLLDGILHYIPSIWGTPIYGNPHMRFGAFNIVEILLGEYWDLSTNASPETICIYIYI